MESLNLTGIGMTSQRTRDRLMQRLVEKGIRNPEVLDVLRRTPRHIFLDEALAHRAYEDCSLPIGYQQTLSQPYIVARMTELLLAVARPRRVLEIGTGSGYQTAILAQIAEQVFSVERIRALQQKARARLQHLKLYNVQLRLADGGLGWPDKGPYDAILSAAAPRDVPPELIEQLAPGGRLVMPIGELEQQLIVVDRTEDGIERRALEAVRFVPLQNGVLR